MTTPISMVTEMVPSSSRVVAAFLLFGFWKAGTPLEIASTPVSAAEPEEKARASRATMAKPGEGGVLRIGLDPVLRAVRLHVLAEHQDPEQAVDDHPDDADHEAVDGDGEQLPGLADATQVQRHQQQRRPGRIPGLRDRR